ncbi:hypothetical protein B0T17DRAFT_123421 [Bombardia bombarda]|uniref:Transmembrane protein n=1 Tax=Bombardia bombarda TaxID=252184 RepID=A0AA39WBH8_9PEZI|nr:hypothetical protein B0T17DRAFT_123421 [Bombardia bombarda]
MERRDIESGDYGGEHWSQAATTSRAIAESQSRPQKTQQFLTARTILGIFAIVLSIAALGIGIKMVVAYGDTGIVHVSFVFIGFTAGATIAWQCLEMIAKCYRRDGRGISPGTHVGVCICISLACVATMGYVGIWVSEGDHSWNYTASGSSLDYTPLYHLGIVLVIVNAALVLIHFILSILACQEVRRSDTTITYSTAITVRYDGVGPVGTARPRNHHSVHYPTHIGMPPYTMVGGLEPSLSSPPIIIARGDLGVEVVESPSSSISVPPKTLSSEKRG